jgi:hypothetical protein
MSVVRKGWGTEGVCHVNGLTPVLLRIGEAAYIAGCGRSKAYELAASGAWLTVETPYGRRVVYAGLMEWLDRLRECREWPPEWEVVSNHRNTAANVTGGEMALDN